MSELDEVSLERDNLLAELRKDKERLDFLEHQNSLKRYTGRCIFRLSFNGDRGWRLHETSLEGSVESVRQAIDDAITNSDFQ